MKKWIIQDSFGLDHLALIDAPEPEPGPGQVLVRMKAASLNFRDLLMVRGLYNPRQPLPITPLSDGVGEVIKVGPGVSRVKPGERVCASFFQSWIKGEPSAEELRSTLGSPLDGTLAEFMVLNEQGVVPAPAHLSDEQAATLTCAGVTAWTALVTYGRLKAGDTVLTLGSGGVSVFALQIAKLFGARVIVTSSSDAKLERLRELGADHTINYSADPDWGKTARKLTGGVDHVIEVGGAKTLDQSLKALRPRGRVSLIGVLSGGAGPMNLLPIIMTGLTVQGIFVGPRQSLEDLGRALEPSGIKPVVDRVFPMEEAAAAFAYQLKGEHLGKVVIRIAD